MIAANYIDQMHDADEVILSADESDEAVEVDEYWITSFGIDYDVEGIVRRLKNGDITFPGYQRAYVWTIKRASRFIESLLLSLPVPGIFLYREPESRIQTVIDGQQRLESLRRFYKGEFDNKIFGLTGVRKAFEGLKYNDLTDEQIRKLNDSIIHATIIRQDKPDDGGSSQFEIFERLNTNATPLSAQEIRSVVYRGAFNELLKELNEDGDWRNLFGRKHRRRRDEELILRFFSLYYDSPQYTKPMKAFLNAFMSSNRHLNQYTESTLRALFVDTVSTIHAKIGLGAFKPQNAVNAALFDAVMVGVAQRMSTRPDLESISDEYHALLSNETFQNLISEATSDENTVKARLNLAIEAFAVAE